MEQLPTDIEEKIEKLPIIPFDGSKSFEELIISKDFTDIFNFYKANYLPDILKAKPELYQKVSLYLTLTNQNDTLLEQTNTVLYKRPFPSIEEFLVNKFYMGYSNATLYPYWKEQLTSIFRTSSPVRKVIFSGCLGCGKSTVARKAFLYVLYRILCLRYPRAVFNIDNDATIANVVIATTLKQVYDVNMMPFVKLMETMPCFQRVMSQRSFENFNLEDPHCPIPFVLEKSSGTVYFPDNIILTSGSQATHFTGMNVVNSFCDEINDKGMQEAIELLNTLDNRFASRFQGSDLVFQSVVSSARTVNSPIGEYVRHLPKDDPAIIKLNPMLWEVKPDPNFIGDGTTFPVLVGNGSIPSKIITDPGELKAIENKTFEEPVGCTLIHVPTVYKSKFELQLDQSIQDIAGMTTNDNNSVFRDTTRLEDLNLVPEISLEANIRENTDLLSLLPKELFELDLSDKWRFKRAPYAKRYCHLDLSGGGNAGQCDSGVCVLHKEWQTNPITNIQETLFVVDFILYVNAKTKIDLNAIQSLMIRLCTEKNANIHTISADQYQCLAGDTKIDLLDGRSLPIKELINLYESEECYTYTYDTVHKKIVPGRIIGGKKTGYKQLYEILLDNGEKIKCTADHLFLLKDCTYKKAKDLTPDDSLMALYKDLTKKGYELTYNPVSKSWKETYKRVAEYTFNGVPKGIQIHHINFKKTNNNPTNLRLMTYEEHMQLHRDHPNMEFLKSGKMVRICWEKRRKNPQYHSQMKKRYPGAANALRKKFGLDYKEKLVNGTITNEEINAVKHAHKLAWLAEHRQNHKIVSIKKIGFEDVYDIQIDNFPNFALSSGVFVHNSLIMLESFEAAGCFEEVNKVSVDIKLEPYLNAARLIESGFVKVGKCPKLRKELEALVLIKNKVTKTTELKDGCDALVGAIYDAQLNYTDIPTIQYKDFKKKNNEFDYNSLIDINTQELASI